MKAVEITGTVDERGHLQLDQPLINAKSSRVRAILLFPDAEEMEEQAWLKAAASNPVFAFLHDPEEDIYTLEDGKPLNDEG
ncbi:MAG: hypothetical protein LH660_15370 [Phormidesmis sp. CAN_BIN36]|nr:hypothetical protein [Phormidesmis sp. CAN_BIN36]